MTIYMNSNLCDVNYRVTGIMLVIVLIVSFVTCSLAQTPCDTANQTLRMDSDCYEALLSVYPFNDVGNSSNATALMMVCGGSTDNTCSQNIRAYFDNCPSSLMNVVEVLCATSPTHSNRYCVDVLPDLRLFDPVESIFNPIAEVCRDSFLIGECRSECSLALQNLRITYGCCFPDLLQFYNDIGSFSGFGRFNTSYGLYLVALPTLLCGIQNTFCDGVPPPGDPDDCPATFTDLYRQNGGQGDVCSLVIRRTITDDTSALGLYNTVPADCRTRFQNFISGCNGIFDDLPETGLQAIQRVYGGFALAAATNNGQSCSMAVSDILTAQNQGEVCIQNYFNRRCSSECRESLMSLTQRHGCCYNSFIAILTGLSTEPDDSIEYIILTREIFSLCGVQNPGLCTGINAPYLTAGERCVSAANQFFAQDDLCTNNYRLLGELSSMSSVQSGANGICTIDTCRSRLNDYADYLLTCQVGNFATDDDNNDDDDDVKAYIRFSNVTRHATCRMRSDGTSCYPVLMFSNMTDLINAAFAPSGACISIFLNESCSSECAQLVSQFFDSAGCCIAEYGNAIFGPNATDMIARLCQIPSNSERCPEITDQQADRCAIAQNVLLDSATTCGNAFFAFQNAVFDDDSSDIATLRENLNLICQRVSCKSAVSEYLEACANVGSSLGNDYEVLHMEFDGFACRQSNGSTQGDCFVLDESDPTITVLGNAFVAGECLTAVSGSCSSACRNTLQTALDSAGCCVALIGDVFFHQLPQIIGVTTTVDEVARACNLPLSRGCAEITDQLPDRCAIAENVLLDNASTCENAFIAFQDAVFHDNVSDIPALQENLNQICQRESCKSAVSESLEACANVGSGPGNVYEVLSMEFDRFACRQSNGNTKGDCFVLDESDPTITVLGNAFVDGECLTAVNGSCSSACRNTLQTALDSAGCCVALIGDVFYHYLEQIIGVTTTVDEVARACNLPLSRDCAVDGRGAVMERKGLGVMTLLFLAGMMIRMLV